MSLVEAVKQAGVVGAGGAGFPTHVKINTKAECLIINAAECEPLIDSDKYICRNFAEELVENAVMLSEHLEAKRTVIATKGKYKAEISALKKAVEKKGADVEIFEMKTFYPAGDEQTMVQQVCQVSVPERGIPIAVGAVVVNVASLYNIGKAVKGEPVTEKFLSVVGEVKEPVILKVPIGTSIRACIEKAQPNLSEYAVITGGPMMGKVLDNDKKIDEGVVTKTTGNLLILPRDHYLIRRSNASLQSIMRTAKSACIQCRMCTDLCPRYLIGHKIRPNHIMRNIWREGMVENHEEYDRIFGEAANCCDCGVCEMFACPMGLSPRKVNGYVKQQLRAKNIQPDRNQKPEALSCVDTHKTPTGRLVARLQLEKYYGLHATKCYELEPEEVFIPFSQHIGKPAAPVVAEGDFVHRGDLIAQADENGLSANIHASVSGIVTEITQTGAKISRKEEA